MLFRARNLDRPRNKRVGGGKTGLATKRAVLAAGAFLALAGCGGADGPGAETVAGNDRGVGLMGQHDFAGAEEVFADVVRAAPDWLDVRVNLAIATLNRQREGDETLALEILAGVLEADPQHLRALYTSAILRFHGGDVATATALFRRVVEADPRDAYAAYFLGQCLLQGGDNEAAAPWFLKVVELDPNLVSAYYTGSLALRRLGRTEEALTLLREFERRRPSPAARTAEIKYLRMGPKAEAVAVSQEQTTPSERPDGPLFGAPTILAQDLIGADGWTITAVDVNADGRQDLVGTASRGVAVFIGQTGPAGAEYGFERIADHPLATSEGAGAVLWGDLDEDGLIDAVLCGPSGAAHWRRTTDGWRPEAALGDRPCAAGAMFDADNDGDLDVFTAGPEGNALYNNNRDGTFARLDDAGLQGGDGRQVLAADLDSDRDLDILVLNREPPHDVWRSGLAWRYDAPAGFDDLKATALQAVTVMDSDADGHREIYGATPTGEILRWRYDGLAWNREPVAAAIVAGDPPAPATHQLDVADFDGDGAVELLRAFGDELTVLDPRTGAILWRQTVPGLATARAAVHDAGRGASVVAIGADGLLMWSPGPGRHPFLAIAPTGRGENAQTRSNASGIGTEVRVRFGGRWSIHDALDPHSGPGQSLQPISVGLGGAAEADFIALQWSDGVSQTELALAAGQRHVIVETQRQIGSCPVLFVWDGSGFRFVSDVLGGAALGYLMAPGKYAPPRPAESYMLDSTLLAPRDGRYQVKLAEPMEENTYLDHAELAVYDLPAGWSMVLDERLAAGGAPATGRPIFYRRSASPVRVTTADGLDVTELATKADRSAPPPGPLDPRFIGLLAADQVLTLTFDERLDTEGAVLVAHGWIEYPYSQTSFAAAQAGVRYRPPTLEARGDDGVWRVVAAEFGYPAGMPRQMALPLPALPAGARALRLKSNMEIYWDALAVVWEAPPELEQPRVTASALVAARVARTGFAKRTTGRQRQPHYDYRDRAPFWDAKAPRGFYSALGDATDLLRDIDGGLAIIGSGEEIHLEFAAAPDPPPGYQRRFVLRFDGWAKDMDLYTRDGRTVEPLPVPQGVVAEVLARGARLNERHNVRFQDGM